MKLKTAMQRISMRNGIVGAALYTLVGLPAALLAAPAAAQTAFNVTNFGQSDFDTIDIGTDPDNDNGPSGNSGAGAVASTHNSQVAQAFTTGGGRGDRFALTSVESPLRLTEGDPGDITFAIHAGGTNPGARIAVLSGATRPRAAGDRIYRPPSSVTVALQGASTYFVVISVDNGGDAGTQKTYDFWSTDNDNEDDSSSGGWSLADTLRWKPTAAAAWQDSGRGQSAKLRIRATSISDCLTLAGPRTGTATVAAGATCTVTSAGSITPPAGGHGISAASPAGITHSGVITTNNGHGIWVMPSSPAGVADDNTIGITAGANITANGNERDGVHVSRGNRNRAANAGRLIVTDEGIEMFGARNTAINSGYIQTANNFGEGIYQEGTYNLTINEAGGTISVNGVDSDGISQDGRFNRIINRGYIISSTHVNAGAIDQRGDDNYAENAPGGTLVARANAGHGILHIGRRNLAVNRGHISSRDTGHIVSGIWQIGGDNTMVNHGTIRSDGIAGMVINNQGSRPYNSRVINAADGEVQAARDGIWIHHGDGITVQNAGTIRAGVPTLGGMMVSFENGNDGIEVDVGGEAVVVNSGWIFAPDEGIVSTGNRNTVTNAGGTIVSTASGIVQADGSYNRAVNAGRIVTSAADAHGMVQRGNNNTAEVSGRIEAPGAAADGIRLDGNNNTLTLKTGAVIDAGRDGVSVVGTGNTVIVEAGVRIDCGGMPVNLAADNTLVNNSGGALACGVFIAPPVLAAVAAQTYIARRAIPPLTLPAATGGTSPYTYRLTPSLPAGLTFAGTANPPTISGTPSAASAAENYTYSVADAAGLSTSTAFPITIAAAPPAIPDGTLYMIGTDTKALYSVNTATGEATRVGGATDFGAGEGRPNALAAVGNTLYMAGYDNVALHTVDTASGMATRVGSAVNFGAGEVFPAGLAAIGNTLYMLGAATDALYTVDTAGGAATRIGTATNFGVGETSPAGLAAVGNTLYMLGAWTDALYTLDTATGEAAQVGGATRFGANLHRPNGLAAVGNTLYMVDFATDALYTVDAGGGIATRVGGATLFGVGEGVPSGLAFVAAAGTMAGTPGPGTMAGMQTVEPLSLSGVAEQSYVVGVSISVLTMPAAAGGTSPYTYSLMPVLPAGLTFAGTADPPVISGTPQTVAAADYTYSVTDAAGSFAASVFAITVTAAVQTTRGMQTMPGDGTVMPPSLPTVAGQSYVVGAAIRPLTLPAARGGTMPYSYSLRPDLPGGLTFDAAADPPVISGTPQTVAAADYTYSVTDAAGSFAAAVFAIRVTAAAQTTDGGGTMTGTPVPGTGPGGTPGDGTGPDMTPGPDTTPGMQTTDDDDTETPEPPRPVPPLTFGSAAIGDLIFVLGRPAHASLPAATGGRGALRYAVQPAVGVVGGLPPGLIFEPASRQITGVASAITAAATYRYIAADSGTPAMRAELAFTVSVRDYSAAERAADLGGMVLPQVMRVVGGGVGEVVAGRVAESGRAGQSAHFNNNAVILERQENKGGAFSALYFPPIRESRPADAGPATDGGLDLQRLQSAAEWLRANHHRRDWKPLLSGSGFTMPVKIAGGTFHPFIRFANPAFWGRGVYRSISGDTDALKWDGSISGLHLGADAELDLDGRMVGGLLVSSLQSDMDFTDAHGDGEYDLRWTSLAPYLGWRGEKGDAYLSAGGGGGDATVRAGGERGKGDVRHDQYVAGGRWRLGGGGDGGDGGESAMRLRLRGELSGASVRVDGAEVGSGAASAGVLQKQRLRTTRVRLGLEALLPHARSGLQSALEFGLRNDGGDGVAGGGVELGWGLEYTGARVESDVRLRGGFGRGGEVREWGVSGGLRVVAGLDGQGLSLDLAPEYGAVDGGLSAVWRENLPGDLRSDASPADREYALRTTARLGYGLRLRGGSGLLTPFAEVTSGGGDGRRLGLLWESAVGMDLSLQYEPGVVMLKGSVPRN